MPLHRRRSGACPGVKAADRTTPSERLREERNVVRLEHHVPPPSVLENPLGKLLESVGRQWRRLTLGGLAAVLCSMTSIASPVFMGILSEFLVMGAPLKQYIFVFSILSISYALEPILSQFYVRTVITAGEKVLAELRKEVFDRLLHEEVGFFDQHRTTEFTNFLAVELDTLRNFIFTNVTRDRGVRSILEVMGVIVVLFCLSWRLAPILAGVILTTAISASLYKRSTKSVEDSQFRALTEMVSVADQAISNIRTVRSFGGEHMESVRFNNSVEESYQHGLLFGRAKAWVEAMNRGAVHLSLIVLFWYGGYLVRQGQLPYRVLVTAIGYVFSLVFATQGVINTIIDFRKARSALRRVESLLSATQPGPTPRRSIIVSKPMEEELVENGKVKARVAASRGDLVLHNVCFSYPMRPTVQVLNRLSLDLIHGTRTALVGQSGSGKSTVSALLCRFYEPSSGQISLNGIPLGQFDRKDWNAAVALVSQEPVLFRGTIYDNICYGRQKGATMHDVVQVAISANAHEFIEELPEGYHTVVGEKGFLLSGGERQRIAIARALLKDAPIVLLDEATSSLDLRSESKVQEALNRLMIGRTVMVIAHRLSTIMSADIIAVLKDGAVIEKGTHDELIARDSHYAQLVHSRKL